MFNNEKSNAIIERAKQSIAGGKFTNFRKVADDHPIIIKNVDGIKITDVDDNVFYDFALSYGPAILGHSNENYKKALTDQIGKYYTISQMSEIAIKAAEKIKQCVPSMELLRFELTGTGADRLAIRVARAYTKKNKVVKFHGQYNGSSDSLVGGSVKDPANPVVDPNPSNTDLWSQQCHMEGRHRKAFDDVYMIEFNEIDALRTLFERESDDIACIIMEPIMLNNHGIIAEKGFMNEVRELCTKHNVVLIFDEVITGFRVGPGGAQEFYGVTPDLTVMSKAIGGGFPVSVYGGKKEIMDIVASSDVLAAGTFNGHPLAAAAIIATIDELTKDGNAGFNHIANMTEKLKRGLNEKAKKYNVPMIIQGAQGAVMPLFTTKDKIINHRDALENINIFKAVMFYMGLKEKGIMSCLRLYISMATTESDVQYLIDQSDEVFQTISVTDFDDPNIMAMFDF